MPLNNPLVNQLFNTPVSTATPVLAKGSLITFHYSFWLNDPAPLVIVTDFVPGIRLRGVNLHYLTFLYVKTVLLKASPGFSYQNIKGDQYISNSFRSYKWAGIMNMRVFDSQFILKMMSIARSFDPSQIQAIRQSVEEQLQQQLLGQASNQITNSINTTPVNQQPVG